MALQFVLQVVKDHRRIYPDSRKRTISGQHENNNTCLD